MEEAPDLLSPYIFVRPSIADLHLSMNCLQSPSAGRPTATGSRPTRSTGGAACIGAVTDDGRRPRHIADRLAASHAARVFGGQQMTATGIEVRAFTEELAPRSPASSETSTCPWPSRQRTCRPFRKTLAARLNVDVKVLERFDPRQYIGPFFRCFDVWLPEWSLILDVPDITFRVTQDVNNDSTQRRSTARASSMCVGRRPLPNNRYTPGATRWYPTPATCPRCLAATSPPSCMRVDAADEPARSRGSVS